MAALNAGRMVTRQIRLTSHVLMVANRRKTSGDGNALLCEAFEQLASTGFGLIDCWQILTATRGVRIV